MALRKALISFLISADHPRVDRTAKSIYPNVKQKHNLAYLRKVLVPRHLRLRLSFTVATTLKEDLSTTLRFVAYHLEIGAELVHVFFDDPTDTALDVLRNHPRVKTEIRQIEDKQANFNTENRIRHVHLQKHNMHKAFEALDTEWLIHIDGDEYLHPTIDLFELLNLEHTSVFLIYPFEILLSPLGENNAMLAHSELEITPKQTKNIFNIDQPYRGILGYRSSKSFVRKGTMIDEFRIHKPLAQNVEMLSLSPADVGIIHYLNFGAEAWAKKTEARILNGRYRWRANNGDDRSHSVRMSRTYVDIYDRAGLAGLVELFRHVKSLSPEQIASLNDKGSFTEFRCDFTKLVKKWLNYELDGAQNAVSIVT